MRDFGIVRPGTTLYVPFATYDSNDPSASVTASGLAVTDIEIFKDGSTTQRSDDAGYTLLDTDGTDFDGITGVHGFSINLADNTVAGFWAAGSQYWVVVSSITVDTGTISFIACTFRIGYPAAVLNTTIATLAGQTSFTLTTGPAEDDALNGMWCVIHDVASAVQCGWAIILDYTGSTKTVTLVAGTTFTAAATDNISVMFPSPMQPTVMGRTLDVSTGGEAGVDWANVGSPTTTVGLSGTTVKTATDVETDTQDIQGRLPAALSSGNMKCDVLAMSTSTTAADNLETAALAYSATRGLAGTALPAAAADAAGGLIVSDAGGLDADAQRADVAAILVDTGTTLDARIPAALVGGRIDANVGSKTVGLALTAQEKADVNTEADTALADAGVTTTVTGRIDAAISSRSTVTTAQVNAECDTALSDYDGPTRAEATSDKDEILTQLPAAPPKNTAYTYLILMVDSTDHVTPETGLTITFTRDVGAGFASATGSIAEVSGGYYRVSASQADMNGDVVLHRFAATGADTLSVEFKTVS